MKTLPLFGLLMSMSVGTPAARSQSAPDATPPPAPAVVSPAVAAPIAPPAAPAVAPAPVVAPAAVSTNSVPFGPPSGAFPAAASPAPEAAPAAPGAAPALTAPAAAATNTFAAPAVRPTTVIPEANGEKGILLNFRNAPLETVLNYLSQVAGFIFLPDPGLDVRGRVDVWSQQPVTKEEAVTLLNSILNKNGYAAIRSGRTLTIMDRAEAKKRSIPVMVSSDPDKIPDDEVMVTQIMPVKYANALQMTKDLLPLLPTYATMTANESGNALVITSVQSDIKRMAKIIKSLDTSISGISGIKVFPLRYADAKDLANELKEIFPSSNSSGRGERDPFGGMARMFGGRGGGDMGGGMEGDISRGTGVSEARRATSRVTAVADERTNSLVVSAPEDAMPTIEQLVKEIDTNAENITELQVFPLNYADPQEMADILTNLFPDDTNSSNNRSAVRMGGRGGGGFPGMFGAGGGSTASASSTRARQKGRVMAVPDPRTKSIIVSAATDLMPQITEMIAQLDANPAMKQNVYVYELKNADVTSIQQALEPFQSQNSRTSSSLQNNNNDPLRQRQMNQGYGSTGSGGLGSGSFSGGSTTGRRN